MRKKIAHSLEVIESAIKKYPRIGMACSFGKDSIVTLHLCKQVNPDIEIFSIMTPYIFPQTLSYKEYIEDLWDLKLQVLTVRAPELNERMWLKDVNKCCNHYKVEPTKHAIKELKLDAWISGLRRTEGTNHRKFTEEVEERDGLVKINPILDWTEVEVWLYHALHNIPINPLYAEGYRSLGCRWCSEPYTEEERGGRWSGYAHTILKRQVRLIHKTITWRVIAVITTFIIAYIFTGCWFASLEISIAANITKTLLYYLHELIWLRYDKYYERTCK